jgi:hypothetical protein
MPLQTPDRDTLIEALKIIHSQHDFTDPDYADDEGDPCIQVTLGCGPTGYALQTGDNSFYGVAYGLPVWAVQWLYCESDLECIAIDLLSQIDNNRFGFGDDDDDEGDG